MSKYRKSDIDRFAAIFKALSNPQRLRIFLKLAGCCVPRVSCDATPGGMHRCVGDLGSDLGCAASTVSHHIKELRNSGLLQVERRGQKIECWISEDTLRRLASFFDSAGDRKPFGKMGKSRKRGVRG
jgi:ArsR family transcriptional regulator, arsenate/arsenite/antimonite-responsive transcriptional repressor